MIEHFGINVSNLQKSKEFYGTVLATLDCVQKVDYGVTVGFGSKDDKKIVMWLIEKPVSPVHIAFSAKSREAVDNFYKTALANGAKDNGPPGIRAHYHPNYYAAFVIDIDGYNIEALYEGDSH